MGVGAIENRKPDNNDLAIDRTILANERTYQAWVRTGLSSLAAGLGVAKFLQDFMLPWLLLILATFLIVFSIIAFLLAAWRYTHLHIRLVHLEVDATPTWMVKAISVLLISCSLLALLGLYV